MILRIEKAKVCGPLSLDLTFNNGTKKRVNVKALLRGPIFRPLKKEDYFKSVKLDSVCGTVVWPNGADFAPEALHALDPIEAKPATKRPPRKGREN
jgi:Protein of unknown function (DUF2442)